MNQQTEQACPCGSGKDYALCCQPLHQGAEFAQTAEQLMRSRYSAFVLQLEVYLLQTWAPETRPEDVEFDPAMSWQKLTILEKKKGRARDQKGWVTFCAEYQVGLQRFKFVEKSRFRKDAQGRWLYIDGEFI